MERHTDIAEDQPEEAPMDIRSELTKTDKMFTAKDIPQIVKLFREADADGGGGLDMEEFCVAMEELYGTVNKEDLIVLHMQIDTNCDKTVDIGELMDFLLNKHNASERMDYKNQPFPKSIKTIPVDQHRAIVGLLFRPYDDGIEPDGGSEVPIGQTRTYQKGQYLSITSNGILNFWTDSFDTTCPIALYEEQKALPFSHKKKMCVNDMVYLRELEQLAVSTSDRQLLFYNVKVFPELLRISHSLIVEDNIVNTMNYWSNGTKAVFSFGDIKGFLSVFISYNVKGNGLFCTKAYETISLQEYPTVYVSALLKNPSKDFLCVKVPIFNDVCSQIRYFPSLDSFAICSSSSKTMVLAALPESPRTKVSKKVFESSGDKEFFTCVEYSPSAGRLVTGGTYGLLRVWFPHKTMSCEQALIGHVKPITHITFNHKDKIFISLSEDKNVRVWSEDGWLCRQSFQVQGMGPVPISSMCYNIHNNELVLANSDIGKYLGRGTDVFKNTLTSHDKPLCSALYHSIFKQVVSVCQNGVVTVWDVLTGKAVMEFKVTPDQHVGLTAMAFDGPQRRLITNSQDGKVRLWNFNNGTELAVLPVTVPWEVTGIVCINNRVFVSGRNSKIIFDLDIEEYDNRFLEHDYLNDISSMDVHQTTLVTASSNGNIVIWDADTAEALYWLNASESPRTQMVGKRAQGRTGSLPVEKSQKNVRGTEITPLPKTSKALTENKTEVNISPLICLKTREVNVDTATLLTSADGYIYAWSVKSKGGLLGHFRAVKDEGAVITAMSTDVNEQILLTGDSSGKIYLWDIQGFGFKNQADKGPFEDINGWHVSLCPPPLLGSWRSHLTGVVSVQCDPACKNIITAGLDCNVRLWTNTGCCIGLFGKDQWGATQLSCEKNADQELEEAGRPGTAETKNSPMPFPESPRSSSPTTKLPNFKAMSNRIKDAMATLDAIINSYNPKPIPTDEELFAEYRRLLKVEPDLDKMKNKSHLPHVFNKKNKKSTQQSENTSTPCPPNTTANSSPHMQQSAGAVKQGSEHTSKHVRFPPISDTVKLTDSQGQFKPQPPQIQQKDTLKGSEGFLTPCPPDILPGQDLHLPPIPTRLQLTRRKTQFKPPPLTTGRTNATKSSLHMQVSASTVKQGSDHTSKRVYLPPISDKVQLTHHQTQFKPHPPQTPLIRGGTDLKQSSPQTASLNQTRSKYGRVLKLQQRDTLKGSEGVLTPCPPDILPGQHLHLPPISDKVQLTHHQTPLTTGRTNATKSTPRFSGGRY